MSCEEQSLTERQKLAHTTADNADVAIVKEIESCDSSLSNTSAPKDVSSTSASKLNGSGSQQQQDIPTCFAAHDQGETNADNSVTSSDSPTNNQYQEIVEKLHKLGNETRISTDNPSNDLLVANSSGSNVRNGVAKTPPSSPIIGSSDCDTKDVLVSIDDHGIHYVHYQSELEMPNIMSLISKDLSEPYSIYTYRYFIHNWPDLCFLVSIIICTVNSYIANLCRWFVYVFSTWH